MGGRNMKYTEILAVNHSTGQKISERFLEDGTRFIKNIPFNPTVFIKLKEQFAKDNIKVEMGFNKWIKITKTGENPRLMAAASQAMGKNEVTREEIIKAEADMLKKVGFVVQVREVEEDD
jgi:hypothetical protein